MARTRFYVLSCSSDGDVNIRFLYIHGELNYHSLPITLKEAKERVSECKEKMKCGLCDAEVHECHVTRKTKTLKHGFHELDAELNI